MAVVLYGQGVAEMRGQIGGIVYSVWRGIGVARRRAKPTRRMRFPGPLSRAILGFLSRHYGTLSSADRTLWETWAEEHPGTDKFGNPFLMTAHQMYISLNALAFKFGGIGGVSDTPPLANLDRTIAGFTAASGTNPGEIELEWTLPGGGDVDDFIQIDMAGPFASPALTKLPEQMKNYGFPAGNSVNHTLTSLVEETWYWFAARYVGKDGQHSNHFTGQAQPEPTP